MKTSKLLFLILLILPTKIFSQIDGIEIYTVGAEFLLDKTSIDPFIIKAVENILPKAVNQDIEGAVTGLTKAIYEKKKIKELSPQFINYARNKITNLSKLFKQEDYFGITMGISDLILVTDDYLKKNVPPDNTFLNTNKIANKKVDTTSINKSVKAVKIDHKVIIDDLKKINTDNKKINCIAFTSFGGYTILYGTNGYFSSGIPKNASEKLKELHDNKKEIKQVAYSPTGGYIILYDKNNWQGQSISQNLIDKLNELTKKGSSIDNVSFSPDGGFVIIYDKSGYATSKIPQTLNDKLKEINSKGTEIKNVSFEDDGGYVVNFGKNGYSSLSISNKAKENLYKLNQNKKTIDFVSFITGGGHIVVYDDYGYSYVGTN